MNRIEEWINSLTHYLGAVLGLIGMGALITQAFYSNNIDYLIGCLIFSLSSILLFSMSGTYHILHHGKMKTLFKFLDHSSIFILIAGSYTPYLLTAFNGTTKWSFLLVQWGLTFFGITFKFFFTGKFKFISTSIYLLMGWMVMFAYPELKENISPLSLKLLMYGGISYSVGVIFYSLRILFMHCIWHFFVLAGCIFIYFSIFFLL